MSFIAAGVVSGSVPTSLHQVTHCKLPKDARWFIAMNRQGDIVLEDKDPDKLCMYQNNGNDYFEKWAKKFPGDSIKGCYKCINSRGELFLQNFIDMDTICYDNNLQKQYSVHHKGKLIDSIDGELFYLEKCRNNEHRIVVHKEVHSAGLTRSKATSQGGDFVQPLTLLPQWKNSNIPFPDPSVCRVQQCYVVVEPWNVALDVFNLNGCLFHWISFI